MNAILEMAEDIIDILDTGLETEIMNMPEAELKKGLLFDSQIEAILIAREFLSYET
jgi:hypothetical protein